MKRLFFACAILIFSLSTQAQDYTGWWTEVDDLISKGQPRSALEKLEKIHSTALEENNGPMLIKALIHESETEASIPGDESSKKHRAFGFSGFSG